MSEFVPGIALTGDFFAEVVQPILATQFPALQYGAALIGPGSEVLGFDTPMSMDHDWGLRVFLFLREQDAQVFSHRIASVLSHELPPVFRGVPAAITTLTTSSSVRSMELANAMDGPVKHHVVPMTVRRFGELQLGCDATKGLSVAQWLSIPSHALGEVVKGAVYLDTTGEITALRKQLAWYPRDVGLYMLAAGWQRIGDEEHLMPRAGHAGSELGSALIGSRLVRDVMHLCFLMEKQHAQYAKWLGTAFSRLDCAAAMEPLLRRVQVATSWELRQAPLGEAYALLARMHNAMGVTREMHTEVSGFHDRPFKVIHGEEFAQALLEQIKDDEVKAIAQRSLVGSVSQWTDNVAMKYVNSKNIQAIYQ
ncbi:hypothetical protein LMH87_010842 [Akanthomyces muscarius]|uniref:DUF4037 domain-containing protein n=1 Tax=Akanthomyces muscarius TaxID=2231603 RepID=A0A9W8Q9F2_AKAMU|nr:hypothetical protein LMH87_010842 [Akanthomyces muscarius]KAJ4150076.1 hypothetical protein LMH87_010842 [Akanthomyces muscarius]